MAEGARIDHSVILDLIPAGTKVLDLGCGDGSLLVKLVRQKGVTGRGIEISEEGVRACIAKGLTVLQGDIDQGLRDYPDGSFDYVVLNQTLQAVKKPDVVLSEMLRVGKKGIVGFPNFAYWKMRAYLFTFGRMPKTEFLPFEWYDTPNIHFCSVLDFTEYCAKNGVTIEKTVYLSTDRGGRVLRGVRPNLFAENAVFLLSARKS
ncbi:MAG: methionine biosynthesis protein (MetW) [Deltaproteobacteria bacterium CSP1-8]|nr:MAG: methionine biosynthesis protein (MetW) [Deltaproteobacteria bacterium CSP1-8]